MRRSCVFLVSILSLSLFAVDGLAQQKLFAVSGQGRGGSPADAKQAAQIGKLESENVDRKAETTQNAGDIAANAGRIGTAEGRIDAAETRLSDIETSCATDQKLRWDGSAWLCVQEQDPTVGIHGKTGAPPDCHDVNAKLLWNASTNAWHCVADQNDGSGGGYGSGYETDPQVGSTHSGRMCRGTGGQVVCDSAGPQVIGGGGLRVSGNLQVGGTIAGDDATFSGAVAADTPTASNHLTTKAYVDQSAPNPPTCTGAGKALQYDGANWTCADVGIGEEGIGVGQTWQDVTGSRATETTYQNTTGQPIAVALYISNVSSQCNLQVSANNSTWFNVGEARDNGGERYKPMYAIVPDDHYYRLIATTGTIDYWSELR